MIWHQFEKLPIMWRCCTMDKLNGADQSKIYHGLEMRMSINLFMVVPMGQS